MRKRIEIWYLDNITAVVVNHINETTKVVIQQEGHLHDDKQLGYAHSNDIYEFGHK